MLLVDHSISGIAPLVHAICRSNWKTVVGPNQPTVLYFYYRYLIHRLGGSEPVVDISRNEKYLPLHGLILNPHFFQYCNHKITKIGIDTPMHLNDVSYQPLAFYALHIKEKGSNPMLLHLLSLKPKIQVEQNILFNIRSIDTCCMVLEKYSHLQSIQHVVSFLITWNKNDIATKVITIVENSYAITCWFTLPLASELMQFFCTKHPEFLLRKTVANCPADTLQQLIQKQYANHDTVFHLLAQPFEKNSMVRAHVMERWIKQCNMDQIWPMCNNESWSVLQIVHWFASTTNATKLLTLLNHVQNKEQQAKFARHHK